MSDTPSSAMNLLWMPPGPVAARFAHSTAQVQIINGPIGSGKTTAALMKLIRLGQEQRVSSLHTITRDGVRHPVRRTRWCAVRDTYRQLWKTTIPSWQERVPATIGKWTGGEGAPASHNILFKLSDGSYSDFTLEFVAIGDLAAEDVLRGYQVTGFYLNELDLLSEDVWTYAKSRTGRFPPQSEGGSSWDGIIADCNAPELDTWLYDGVFNKTDEERVREGIELFRQPSALSAQAENTVNLKPGYYENQARGQKPWFIKRMLRNEPGYSRSGTPVYDEFNDLLHTASTPIEPVREWGLVIGLDAGLNPAAVFGQRTPAGVWHILGELVGESGTGAARFGDMLARYLAEHFPGWPTMTAWADPSAAYGADKKNDEQTWIEVVQVRANLRVNAAPTNSPTPRWEAVRLPLTRLIDGQPGFQLDPSCKTLRGGFNAGYRFRKKNAADTGEYREQAEKNKYSHPHDALQYLLSGGGEDAEIRGRGDRDRDRRRRLADRAADYNPLSGAES